MPPVVKPGRSGQVVAPTQPQPQPQREPQPQPHHAQPAMPEYPPSEPQSAGGLAAAMTKVLLPSIKELLSNNIDGLVSAFGLSEEDIRSVLQDKLSEYGQE